MRSWFEVSYAIYMELRFCTHLVWERKGEVGRT